MKKEKADVGLKMIHDASEAAMDAMKAVLLRAMVEGEINASTGARWYNGMEGNLDEGDQIIHLSKIAIDLLKKVSDEAFEEYLDDLKKS
jgi:hypothetical protein